MTQLKEKLLSSFIAFEDQVSLIKKGRFPITSFLGNPSYSPSHDINGNPRPVGIQTS